MELFQFILDYYFIPVLAWLAFLHMKQQQHDVILSVLERQIKNDKESHASDMDKLNEMVNRIYTKLDKIEDFLRK
jgi:hypothetical protein